MGRELVHSLSSPIHSMHTFSYGAIPQDNGVLFSVYSRSATAMWLLLYNHVDDTEPSEVIRFNQEYGRLGDIWTAFISGIGPGQLYHFQADGPYQPEIGQRFDKRARLIDPYAKALAGNFQPSPDGIVRPPKCVVVDDQFDWQGDRHVRHHLADTVVYEMHVRGFTNSETSEVDHPGSYLGVIEKIPYLIDLGVTAVELMPIHEFPMNEADGTFTDHQNYWGYETLAFFAPHRGYATSREPGAQVREFKEMVRALHEAGIEVILDVVFNHTAEGNENGPTLSFRGLENQVYYHLEQGGKYYSNYSGCGNAINGNHPVVREMIFHCLRYWTCNYHIDGFRFDLASILSRDRSGHLVPNPPLVEAIAEDPLLADTKLIAEAWDAAGAYQVGSFSHIRWAEWNGRYRDDIRRFWRGDVPSLGDYATRISGSSDLYQKTGREPFHGVNFITAHDGFTLNDLVSYEHKHNYANREDNRDGENNNISMNFGVEGPTDDPAINAMRERQIKNFLATLFLSQGVPMLLSGDECRRTQRGNNNTYCQDNEISWFDWSLVDKHRGLYRFCKELIHFRLNEPTLRQRNFLTGQSDGVEKLPDVSWYNVMGEPVKWEHDRNCLMCILGAKHSSRRIKDGSDLMIMVNTSPDPQAFELPDGIKPKAWSLVIDTSARSPLDIFPKRDGTTLFPRVAVLPPRSLKCYTRKVGRR